MIHFLSRQSHDQALIIIRRYVLQTREKGLVLTPMPELNIDAYPGADFDGLYGYEDSLDPVYVGRRTGYVICGTTCPMLWKSSLQTGTAPSTMEAKAIAMAAYCRELVSNLDIIEEIGDAVRLGQSNGPRMYVRIHKDDA